MEEVIFDPQLFIYNFFNKKKYAVGLQTLTSTKYLLHVSNKQKKPRFKVHTTLHATILLNETYLSSALQQLQAEIDLQLKADGS